MVTISYDTNMCESGNKSENVRSSQVFVDITHIKSKRQIRELKEFQLDCEL